MDNYIKKFQSEPSFEQKGVKGYNYKINNANLSISYVDCFQGHDKYCINKLSTCIYYIIEGNGTYSINGTKVSVQKNDIVEIPPNTEYVFTGNMKYLLIMNPSYNPDYVIEEKENDLY